MCRSDGVRRPAVESRRVGLRGENRHPTTESGGSAMVPNAVSRWVRTQQSSAVASIRSITIISSKNHQDIYPENKFDTFCSRGNMFIVGST